ERGLAGSGQAGDHDQLIARQIDVDVLQVVDAGSTDRDPVMRHITHCHDTRREGPVRIFVNTRNRYLITAMRRDIVQSSVTSGAPRDVVGAWCGIPDAWRGRMRGTAPGSVPSSTGRWRTPR